uniref:Membrane protein insertase YidC n=2 Tax=Lygus hesperus TaxID=30085 RepID=A0A0A9YRS4_LYGHE
MKENHSNIKMFNNTIEYELNSKVVCSIDNDHIIYLVKLPVFTDDKYKLYLLQSVPIIRGTEYVTIIPQNRFILVDKYYNISYSTNKICYRTNDNQYYCNQEQLCKGISKCSQNIIKHNSLSECKFTKILIEDPYVSRISETGHIVIATQNESIVEDKRPEGNILTRVKGAWIIQPSLDEISVNNIPIQKVNSIEGTLRVPLIPSEEISKLKTHPLELNLKDYSSIPKIDEHWPFLLSNDINVDYDYLHFIISPLYIIIIITALIFGLLYIIKKRRKPNAQIITQPMSSPLQFFIPTDQCSKK